MKTKGFKNPNATLIDHGITSWKTAYWNLCPKHLMDETISRRQGTLTSNGTLSVRTGKFTGRAPRDRFIVIDDTTRKTVDWGEINQPFEKVNFFKLKKKLCRYLSTVDLFIKDAAIVNDNNYRQNVRVIAEMPYSAHFVHNMFVRLSRDELTTFSPDWVIFCAPGFKADPSIDGTRQENFSIIDFSERSIIIGGTGYTGEIKKGMFSVLNYILPTGNRVLGMHCSANIGLKGDSAIFFGLSGTGKTTLSADPERQLVGDDEHGWSDNGIFNFEGGCYAKCIGLNQVNEPDIFNAIKPGAILENVLFFPGTSRPDFEDTSITENTRVSYPLHHIKNHYPEPLTGHPKNIFFLTCDAFGILPPISKLTPAQAMFYFISGYTAKVAGTEEGINEPQATFSACFGAPFMPLHPSTYAHLLGKKIKKHNSRIWLVNTGWTGGPYGEGTRIKLDYTRSLISQALSGQLDEVSFTNFAVFNLKIPSFCPDVPPALLHPRNLWRDKDRYNSLRIDLAVRFIENFNRFRDKTDPEIIDAAPELNTNMATAS